MKSWAAEGAKEQDEMDFAGSWAEAIMAVATLGATLVAIYFIWQNRETLLELRNQNKELRRQNDIMSDARLQIEVLESDSLPDACLTLEECNERDGERELGEVRTRWQTSLASLSLPYAQENEGGVYVKLQNLGRTEIESTAFHVELTVGHLEQSKRFLNPPGVADDHFARDFKLVRMLHPSAPPVFIQLVQTGPFPKTDVQLSEVRYTDSRDKGYGGPANDDPKLRVKRENPDLLVSPKPAEGTSTEPGPETEADDYDPFSES